MPKRKAPEPEPDAFERMARELGCDETGEEFERALARVLPPRRPGEPAPRIADQPTPKGSRRRTKSQE
jgi:hypothetical protein